jgi:hypothetical protein
MRKGINKFDLRDDEWMMVEDEFLQTAELFTRHLHLREYDRLKEIVQTKKDIVRPVVMSAKPSEERQMQMRAEKKTKSQKKALKDAFSSSGKADIEDYLGAPKRATSSKRTPASPIHSDRAQGGSGKQRKAETHDTDSDDLDALSRATHPKQTISDIPFVKPALPSQRLISTSRIAPERAQRKARESTFDFLDGYSSKRPSSPTTSTPRSNLLKLPKLPECDHHPSPADQSITCLMTTICRKGLLSQKNKQNGWLNDKQRGIRRGMKRSGSLLALMIYPLSYFDMLCLVIGYDAQDSFE